MHSLKIIIGNVLAILVLCLACGILYVTFIPLNHVSQPHFKTMQDFPNLLANWDGNNYLEIATNGYQAKYSHLYGFMPLYPFFIRLLMIFSFKPVIAALTISLISLIFALWFLEKLILLEIKDEKFSIRTVLYMLYFPTSFFFYTAYTESLFLLLSVMVFYCLKRKQIFLAAFFTTLATVTRITGIVLIPIIIWGILELKEIPIIRRLISILIVPLALIIFMLYLYLTTGDFLSFIHIQQNNFQTTIIHNPFIPLVSYIFNFSLEQIRYQLGIINLFDFIIAFITPLLLLLASKKLSIRYILYGLGVWLLSATTGRLNSLSRYILILFPIFVGLAILGQKRWFDVLYKICGISMLLVWFMWFLIGNWVA